MSGQVFWINKKWTYFKLDYVKLKIPAGILRNWGRAFQSESLPEGLVSHVFFPFLAPARPLTLWGFIFNPFNLTKYKLSMKIRKSM